MLQYLKTRRADARDNDSGFTLIELMVVVLIIAILLAIAVPTFLGVQSKSKDRAAQSSARNALSAAKTLFADTGSYTGVTAAGLLAVEPSLTYSDDVVSTGFKNVSVSVNGAGTEIVLAVLSANNTCFAIKDSTASGTTYGKATPAATCNGSALTHAFAAQW